MMFTPHFKPHLPSIRIMKRTKGSSFHLWDGKGFHNSKSKLLPPFWNKALCSRIRPIPNQNPGNIAAADHNGQSSSWHIRLPCFYQTSYCVKETLSILSTLLYNKLKF